MNTAKMKVSVLGLAAALAAPLALAQNTHGQIQSSTAGQNAMSSTSEIRFSQMRDATVKSEDGKDVGKVQDLLVNPRTGKIQCAVIGKGGFLGIGEKLVPVPWNAISSASGKELALNMDAQKLKGAPTLERDYSNLNTPGFQSQVREFYSGAPSAVGGSETPGGIQSGSSKSPTKP
ncbi:MAG TPA: PRC-barrel domain-containing protein [Verrucomicrobiae bacterium]|nr:PRC-barrel domain-containing protein [Verrucomicrobiae bacterium]